MDNIIMKGFFTCYNRGEPEYCKQNTITAEASKIIGTNLIGITSSQITHLMFLENLPETIDLKTALWSDVRDYLAPHSALALGENLRGTYDKRVKFRGTVDQRFQVPVYRGAVLVVNGNLESNQSNLYTPTGSEQVFSIISIDPIQKASWADFIVEWDIEFIPG